MMPTIPIALFGWIPVVLWLFSRLRAHYAVIAGFFLAWMFLPQYAFPLPGFPDYGKVMAASLGILLGTAIFNPSIFSTYRYHAVDMPVTAWCVVPFFTALSNGLGAHEGISAVLDRVMEWGVPWFIGRLYFGSVSHLRDLAIGIFIGGLVYVPFCLFEVVMSPRLHRIIYGFHPHVFGQAKRGGGWRPVVFMEHGLMTAMWMTSATLCGLLVLKDKCLRIPGIPSALLWCAWGVLAVTTVLCKSTGALFLLLLGIALFFGSRLLRSRLPLYVLMVLPLVYMTLRGTELWSGQNLVDAAARVSSVDRAGSLEFRMKNENLLIEKALIQPTLGWGRYRRSFVRDDNGEIISVPDGLWVLALGRDGLAGLVFLTLTLLVPELCFLRLFPPSRWREPSVAALAGLQILIGLYMIDNLFNNMFNPAFLLACGGLAGLVTAPTGGITASSGESPSDAPSVWRPRAL
jgi:hypothetical protein